MFCLPFSVGDGLLFTLNIFEPLIQHDQIQTPVAGEALLVHCRDAATICASSFILILSLNCTGTQGDGRYGNQPWCCGAQRFVAVDPMAHDPLAAS